MERPNSIHKENKKREPVPARWPTDEELLGEKYIKEEEMYFEVPLEHGDADRHGDRESAKEIIFDRGDCFLVENGQRKQIRFAEAGALVIKYNKHHLLDWTRREVLGINKLLDKKKN